MYVTHDQTEALTLGDRVAVLRKGHVQQVGTPRELYNEPANLFVAGFIGSPAMNLLPAHMDGDQLHLPMASLTLPTEAQQRLRGRTSDRLVAGIRPEHFEDIAFGKYMADAAALDAVIRAQDLLVVWAAGNEREDVGVAAGEAHHHWPGCGTTYRDAHASEEDERFDTLGGQPVLKNGIVVGAVRDITTVFTTGPRRRPSTLSRADVAGAASAANHQVCTPFVGGGGISSRSATAWGQTATTTARAASASASRWPAPSSRTRRSCSSTRRPAPSIRNPSVWCRMR